LYQWGIEHRKHQWIGHVLKRDGILHEITKGRRRGKPTGSRKKIQVLNNLANNDGCLQSDELSLDRE